MKKSLLLFLLCAICYGHLFSQTSAVHFSIIPSLSTNGKEAKNYTNGASINLLVGVSQNEKAFTLGGLGNIIYQDATGLQLAGLLNYVENEAQGLQIAGLANITRNNFKGAQIGGLANVTADMKGMQVGGLANVAANVAGIQIGGLANIGANTQGIQIGGLVNIASEVQGLQIGGLVNIGANTQGIQIGGLTNIAADIKGIQIGGLANVAANVHGLQIAGLVNRAMNVHGLQIAGLVNIAYDNDYPIGLINLIQNGEMGIGVTYSGIGSTILGFRSGGRVTYGILGLGYNHKTDLGTFVTELGLGAHIHCTPWFRINHEIKQENIGGFTKNSTNRIGYSLLPAFKITPQFEIFGGPTISYMKAKNVKNTDLFPSNSLWKKHTDSKLEQVFIGYEVGVQFHFKKNILIKNWTKYL